MMKSNVLICFACLSCITNFILLFFFNDTATTEIYTLSLHDALPICNELTHFGNLMVDGGVAPHFSGNSLAPHRGRSEEHTSELQSQSNLVCRLLLEKKKCSHDQRPDLVLRFHAIIVTNEVTSVRHKC